MSVGLQETGLYFSQEGKIIEDNTMIFPEEFQTRTGMVFCGTDKGPRYYEANNEDKVVVDPSQGAFAVIDGIGGHKNGRLAATLLAEALREGFGNNRSFEEIQETARQRMLEAGMEKGGACYLGVKVVDNQLEIGQAGDVRLIILSPESKIVFQTVDENRPDQKHVVTNSVNAAEIEGHGRTTNYSFPLRPGYRVIAASDGLWDNFSSEEIAEMASDKPIEQAFADISERLMRRMENYVSPTETPYIKPDHRSLLIYDHAPGGQEQIKQIEERLIQTKILKPSSLI